MCRIIISKGKLKDSNIDITNTKQNIDKINDKKNENINKIQQIWI